MSEAAAPILYRRDGEFLVVRTGAVLPARCVRTNQPVELSDGMQVETIRFTRGWILPLAVVLLHVGRRVWPKIPVSMFGMGMLMLALLAGVAEYAFSWKAKLSYGLVPAERRAMKRNMTLVWLARVAGLVCFSIGMKEMSGASWWLIFPGIPLFIGGLGITRVYPQPLIAVRYQDGEFWLKGASPEFLDSLDRPDREL